MNIYDDHDRYDNDHDDDDDAHDDGRVIRRKKEEDKNKCKTTNKNKMQIDKNRGTKNYKKHKNGLKVRPLFTGLT